MNQMMNPSDSALAMYATACESHQRRDWREASHALAKALKQALEAGASRRRWKSPASRRRPVTPRPKPAKAAPKATGAVRYDMSAGSLTAAMRLVCKVADRKMTIPICTMVHMAAHRGLLYLTANNLDSEIMVTVEAPALEAMCVVVPAWDLLQILAKLPKAAQVMLTAGETRDRVQGKEAGLNTPRTSFDTSLHVAADGGSWKLAGGHPGDMPCTRAPGEGVLLGLSASELARALAFVTPAISDEQTRYYLNGAFLHAKERGALSVVATDGRRLAKVDLERRVGPRPAVAAIVPRQVVPLVLDMLKGADTMALNVHAATHFSLEAGSVRIISKLIDGSFPDYMRVIPSDNARKVTVDREAFAAAVKGVASVSKEESRAVRFTVEAGRILLTCRNMDGATAEREVAADYRGEGFEVGFNATFVLEAMASFAGERVTLAFAGSGGKAVNALAPCLVADDDAARLLVLMPLRA